MDGLIRGLALVQIVGRNAIPLVGILFDGWPASNVVLLYFIDTLLSLGVVFAGVAREMATTSDVTIPATASPQLQTLAVAVLLCAVIALPLALPIGIALASSGFSFEMLRDRSLWIGIVIQCTFAAWSYRGLYRALRTHTAAQLRLKQRFGLILMRWVAVLMACYFLLQFGTGKVVLVLLVLTYVVASIVAEVAPHALLRGTPADDSGRAVEGAADAKRAVDRHNRRVHRS
jgi:hypothetical protein